MRSRTGLNLLAGVALVMLENWVRDSTARRFRGMAPAPGSSKPAAALVADFLERPAGLDAYRARPAKGE